MIRCVRLWTGDDRNSHFEEGVIDLEPGQRGDVPSGRMATMTISFEETAAGGAFACTELVAAADRSLVALLGASPGASTAAFVAIGVLEKCFPNELTATGWLAGLKEIIPSYGILLIEDANLLRRVRADTAAVLKIENV
jgi:hypothetical protein